MNNSQPTSFLRDKEHVRALVEKVITDAFPELFGQSIRVREFEGKSSVNFRSRPITHTMLNPLSRVKYQIEVNPLVYDKALPEFAAEGIMAHELGHTAFYVRWGWGCTVLSLRTFISHEFHVQFERATDVDAITRGYGPGIKLYREWQSDSLTPDEQAHKDTYYFTPEGIDLLVAGHEKFPWLRAHWMAAPPKNVEEIQRDIERAENGALQPELLVA